MNRMRLSLAYAQPQHQNVIAVEAPEGTTLAQALALFAPELRKLRGSSTLDELVVAGVWGRIQPPHYALREGDRIEIYRPLKADPKQARRARAGQGGKPRY